MLQNTEMLSKRSRKKFGPRETKMINRNERSKAKRDIDRVQKDKYRKKVGKKGN
jgi:hypothetical protein